MSGAALTGPSTSVSGSVKKRAQEVVRATFYKDAQKVPADGVAIAKLVLDTWLASGLVVLGGFGETQVDS